MPASQISRDTGTGAYIDTYTTASGKHRQKIIRETDLYYFRAITPRIVGRGTIDGTGALGGQGLLTFLNNQNNTNVAVVTNVNVDVYTTQSLPIGTAPPIIRIYRFTWSSTPTGGSPATTIIESNYSNYPGNPGGTVLADASADGTNSTTQLSVPVGVSDATLLTAEHAPRMVNNQNAGVGYEMADRIELLRSPIYLPYQHGLHVRLTYPTTASNPNTNHWIAGIRWGLKLN